MSPLRVVLIVCALLALSACGSSKTEPAKPDTAASSSAIEAIDELAEVADFTHLLDDPDAVHTYWCPDEEETNADEDCQPTQEESDELRRQQEEFIRALQPAKDAEPRAVARLQLKDREPESDARLVAWRNSVGKLCVQTQIDEEGSGPDGPCRPDDECGKLCLDISALGGGTGTKTLYLLGGVVASEADTLRLALDDGREIAHRLTGPIVPGFDEYRVFMLDLGRALDQRLELLHDGKTIAEEKRSPGEIMWMRCVEDFPPALPTQDSQDRRSQRNECLMRAGSQ